MEEKRPLDADAMRGDAAHREILVDPAGTAPNDNAFEHLDAFPGSLDDFGVNANSVAGAEHGDLWSVLLGFNLAHDRDNHRTPSFLISIQATERQAPTPLIRNTTESTQK